MLIDPCEVALVTILRQKEAEGNILAGAISRQGSHNLCVKLLLANRLVMKTVCSAKKARGPFWNEDKSPYSFRNEPHGS